MKKVLCMVLCAMLILSAGAAMAAGQHEITHTHSQWFNAEDNVLSQPQVSVMAADEPAWFAYAVEFIRGVMVRREGALVNPEIKGDYTGAVTYKISIDNYSTDAFYEAFDWMDAAVEKALLHTGVANEGDYLHDHLSLWSISGSGSGYPGGSGTVTFTIGFVYHSTAEMEAVVDAAVEELIRELDIENGSDYAKVKAIYDWICSNVVYDYEHLGDESYHTQYTAYGALIDRTSVCQGYSNLFYRLALRLGVDCRIVTGLGVTYTDAGRHAWNIVRLGNKYYNLDATWDSSVSTAGSTYEYFLKGGGTNQFTNKHIRDSEFSTEEFNAAYPMSETDYVPGEEPEPEPKNPVVYGMDSAAEFVDDELNINLRITGEGNAVIIFAMYKDDAMVDCMYMTSDLSFCEDLDVKLDKADFDKIKVFIWDSFTGMGSLFKSAEFKLSAL